MRLDQKVNKIRKASHAGKWYEAHFEKLNRELRTYLYQAEDTLPKHGRLKAMIAPHAGLKHSGPIASWAYKNLIQKVKDIDRIVLLGPSHHVYLDWIGTTGCTAW